MDDNSFSSAEAGGLMSHDSDDRPPLKSRMPRVETVSARTYCGPLHGACWLLSEATPPATLFLPHGGSSLQYRLVLDQRSGLPARDHSGNYVYISLD